MAYKIQTARNGASFRARYPYARAHRARELRIARLIQQTLLPKTLPELPGYKLSAFYRPARERVIGIIAIWELPRLSYPHG